jgi:SAM-dependent methyltransferase
MRFEHLQRNWDEHGRVDPLWAVLTADDKRGNRWDPEEFFATGRRDVAEMLQEAESLGVAPRRGRALDFGCGVGRLTQALAADFEHATGVDIAPSMVEHAREFNRHGARCDYVVNNAPHLRQFADSSFDLVFSHITLQHIRPQYSIGYVAEFVRVLRPGGLCVFQLPHEWHGGVLGRIRMAFPNLVALTRRLRGRRGPVIEMYAVPRARVERTVAAAGGRVARALACPAAGPGYGSLRYFVQKAPEGP